MEFKKISLGFDWNPDMSYKDFCSANPKLSKERSWEVFNLIDKRYIEKRYENK